MRYFLSLGSNLGDKEKNLTLALFSLKKEGVEILKRARIIDIDIILAEDFVIRKKELEIPHPSMEKRNFVLLPFVEISSDTIHPVFNEDMKTLWKKSDDRSIVKQIKRHSGHKE
jgi:7,8-dihydro-6-hydroxymethylpterin-pyrophosphokinase